MLNREASLPNDQERRRPTAVPADTSGLPQERRVIAWVGKSVVFTGHLVSSEDMTIDGRVEGTIDLRNHSLTIGPDADIHADIIAKVVTVLGGVTGSITASTKVDIRETGSVDGDITCPTLALAEGAVLRGRVNTETTRHPHPWPPRRRDDPK